MDDLDRQDAGPGDAYAYLGGLPVYEAMGYVVTSRFGMYTPMEAGAEHA